VLGKQERGQQHKLCMPALPGVDQPRRGLEWMLHPLDVVVKAPACTGKWPRAPCCVETECLPACGGTQAKHGWQAGRLFRPTQAFNRLIYGFCSRAMQVLRGV
jgi:hypothetical protein